MVPQIKNMNIFYINLKKDLDRRQHFLKNEMEIKRFPAVYAKKYEEDKEFKKKITLMTQSKIFFNKRSFHEEINSIGAIGCSLSHYYLWCSFLNGKIDEDYLNYIDTDEKKEIIFKKNNSIEDEYLFVLEDDAIFNFDKDLNIVQKGLTDIINNVGDNWDIYLVDCYKRDDQDFQNKEDFSIVNNNNNVMNLRCKTKYCKVLSYHGMYSYIIKKSSIKKIIEYYYPIEVHIDAFLGLLAQKKIINIITLNNKILHGTRSYNSTINHSFIIDINNKPIIVASVILLAILICLLFIIFFKK